MKTKPMLKIESVEKDSLSFIAGLKSGDCLLEINGYPIRDVIDFQFHSADAYLDITLLRNKKKHHLSIERDDVSPLGLDFSEMTFGHCGNRCKFCFIDQNPKNMRESIYLKDEDYRLSFMYGNYVTLTRVKQEDLERIVEQRLSPLYISIHAVQTQVRKDLLGIRKDDHMLDKLRFLKEHDIEMHGQIVLCPNINDGDILNESVETLSDFYPQLKTLAIVPVGLTKHRERLPDLVRFTSESAKVVMAQMQQFQKQYTDQLGVPFVYLSDEFYLLTDTPFPVLEQYGEFQQIDNGVGMTPLFLDTFHAEKKSFPDKVDHPLEFEIVSGVLAGPILEKEILPVLNVIDNVSATVSPVSNQFYGEEVTVSGLLTGQDILEKLRDSSQSGSVLLPSNCVNADGIFLDDLKPQDIEDSIGRSVHVIEDFSEIWQM